MKIHAWPAATTSRRPPTATLVLPRRVANLEIGEEVWVQTAPFRTLIFRNPEVDHFTILREKLRWGAR